jgi:hypothetical protein
MAAPDLSEARIRGMMPFLFPGATKSPEDEQDSEPPFHPELEQYSFFELYAFIFDKMLPGETIIDAMKRIDKSEEPIDDVAKWVSELFVRGEAEIVGVDWVMTGIRAGKVGYLEDLKWELEENGIVTSNHTAEDLAPRARVLAAEDSRVRIEGSEDWIPIEKIKFNCLIL